MEREYHITHWSAVRKDSTWQDNKKEGVEENFINFAAFIKALYKKDEISYPKFYKMDNLSKLGFLTAEKLMTCSSVLTNYSKEEIGIIIGNSSSSLNTDLEYQETIKDPSAYFPSPSVFVYTLPNILIGEICIRHQLKGENAFLVSERFDPEQLFGYVKQLLDQGAIRAAICGWVEYLREDFESLMFTVERIEEEQQMTGMQGTYGVFNADNIYRLYQQTRI